MATATSYTDDNLPNSIATRIEQIRNGMDQIAVREALTNEMIAGEVLRKAFENAKTAKIPTMDVSAAGNYSPTDGYPRGVVEVTEAEYTLKYDRGISYSIDSLETIQSGQIASIAEAASNFMRYKMVPEIDATRISQAVAKTKTALASHVVTETAALTKADILTKIGDGLDKIFDDRGIDTGMTIFVNNNLKGILRNSTEITKVRSVDGSTRALDLSTMSIDGNAIKYIPSSRMMSAYNYTSPDGADGSGGGFAPSSTAQSINFLIVAPGCAEGVVVLQRAKYFTPDENQRADAHLFQFRICHDLIVKKNSGAPGIYASLAPASTREPESGEQGTEQTLATKAK